MNKFKLCKLESLDFDLKTQTTEQGRLLSYLRALQDKANETVKEASAPEELKGTLDNLFAFVGISWDRKLPPRPKQIASR